MQSELVHIEAELSKIELENKISGDRIKASFQVSLFDLKNSSGTSKDTQWRKALEIREKLKIYSKSSIVVPSIVRRWVFYLLTSFKTVLS